MAITDKIADCLFGLTKTREQCLAEKVKLEDGEEIVYDPFPKVVNIQNKVAYKKHFFSLFTFGKPLLAFLLVTNRFVHVFNKWQWIRLPLADIQSVSIETKFLVVGVVVCTRTDSCRFSFGQTSSLMALNNEAVAQIRSCVKEFSGREI